MENKAARYHGTNDIRVDSYELPELKRGEVLLKVYADSCCMSSYKAAIQGIKHKRIPDDVAEHPTIVGHEFCGEVVALGEGSEKYHYIGQKASLQTTLPNTFMAPGYSYEFCGGDTQYAIIPEEFVKTGNLIEYLGEGYYQGALAEPYSCAIGSFHANYHNVPGKYEHEMGIKENGTMLLMAATGPLGMAAIDYILHTDIRPSKIVVTGRSESSISRERKLYTPEEAKKSGIELIYFNISDSDNQFEDLMALSGGKGYDDVYAFVPEKDIIELGGKLLGFDGCLNVFAGPSENNYFVPFDMYEAHYSFHHVCGISGGNSDDMAEAMKMFSEGKLRPEALISYIGGLNAVPDTVVNLPGFRGGKKLIYTDINMPLTAIEDFEELGKDNEMYARLAEICAANGGMWCLEAENYLLATADRI